MTLEILWNSFKATADMMGVTVWRTAYSTIVRDSRDASAGLCDARGRLVAQADLIPALSGAMHLSLKTLLEDHFPIETIEEGDVLILNHPYCGGTHTSDIILYSPVFAEGRIIAFAVSIAHHIDLGSAQATGMVRATDLYQEGLLIPPLKLYERGKLNTTLWQLIESNVRYPKDVLGDLRAQIAANNLGVREMHRLIEKYGVDMVARGLTGVIEYGERIVRAEIARIPDGIYEGEGYLDDDGNTEDIPVRVKVKIKVEGSDITYDFTGSDSQRVGNMNSVPTAVMAALGYATKCVSNADLPENEGSFLAIHPILPRGSIVNPIAPVAVLRRHTLVQRVADTLVQTFAQAVPEKVAAASCGNTCTYSTVSPTGLSYSNLGGGFGATAFNDGMSAIQVHLSKCMGVTVEDIELTSGTMVERFELRRDSGGPGRQRGGLGVQQDVRIVADEAIFSMSSDAETTPPRGLFAGLPGLPGRKYLNPGTENERRLYRKTVNFRVRRGDVISLQTPGGGGYGDPFEREPLRVRDDVQNGAVSKESAFHDYGVVLDGAGEVDLRATLARRDSHGDRRPDLSWALAGLLHAEELQPISVVGLRQSADQVIDARRG